MLEVSLSIHKYTLQEQSVSDHVIERWKAVDSNLQRDVSMTFLRPSHLVHPTCVQRFQQAVHQMVALNHPNIESVYDLSLEASEEGSYYVVTPYLLGPTLADYIGYIARTGKYPHALALLQLCIAIGSAIDYLHQQDILYGNLAPENILLDRQDALYIIGNPLLTCVGFAEVQNCPYERASGSEETSEASLYRAPEQVLGKSITKQSDLYALGVIIYELCTGMSPFAAPEPSQEQADPFMLVPPTHVNPWVSEELEAVLLRSIAKEPERRFATIQTMLCALARALQIAPDQVPCMGYHSDFSASLQAQIVRERNQALASAMVASRHLSNSGQLSLKSRELARKKRRMVTGQLQVELPSVPPPSKPIQPVKGRVPRRKVLPVVMVLLILIGSALLWALENGWPVSHSPVATTHPVVGQVTFLSSGAVNTTSDQGINDEVRVTLHLPNPAPGKHYYAWLQNDAIAADSHAILLGQLSVIQNGATLLYVDPQHNDLLKRMSRFLVTEEDAAKQPALPSSDKATWRYLGIISNDANPKDQSHYSLLDHLRHLLAFDPTLDVLGLHGGLAIWLYRNVGTVQQLAQEALNNFGNADTAQQQDRLIQMLDYLDGANDVGQDVPAGTPLLVDPVSAQAGLLQIHAYQNPPGYLYHIGIHLLGLVESPGATAQQKEGSMLIVSYIDVVQPLLEQIRTLASQLVALPSDQLAQPAAKDSFSQLAQLAQQAYKGPDGKHGVSWIYVQLNALATIAVTTA